VRLEGFFLTLVSNLIRIWKPAAIVCPNIVPYKCPYNHELVYLDFRRGDKAVGIDIGSDNEATKYLGFNIS